MIGFRPMRCSSVAQTSTSLSGCFAASSVTTVALSDLMNAIGSYDGAVHWPCRASVIQRTRGWPCTPHRGAAQAQGGNFAPPPIKGTMGLCGSEEHVH